MKTKKPNPIQIIKNIEALARKVDPTEKTRNAWMLLMDEIYKGRLADPKFERPCNCSENTCMAKIHYKYGQVDDEIV